MPAPHPTSLAPPDPPSGNERFPALDGVRGLAMLMVLFDHADSAGLRLFPGADLGRLGKYGVYLFFVLSAFLLTHPFLQRTRAELENPRIWAAYLLRRFLRIYPLYALFLGVRWIKRQLPLEDGMNHLLLRDGQKHLWTIAVEFKFYLVLPLLILALCAAWKRSPAHGLAAGALLCLFLAFGVFPADAWWSVDRAVWLSRNLEPFLLGAAAAWLYSWFARRGVTDGRAAAAWNAVAALALAATVLRLPSLFNLLFPSSDPRTKFDDDPLVCGVIWSLFLLAVLLGSPGLRRILEWPPLRYAGLVSYSAYLLHREFLADIHKLPLPSLARLALYLVVVIAAASIAYFLVERPLSKVRLPPPAPPPRPDTTPEPGTACSSVPTSFAYARSRGIRPPAAPASQ